ncbi:MAG: hypothetical protein ACK51A_08210, partial [Sphingobacteriia bacterium]
IIEFEAELGTGTAGLGGAAASAEAAPPADYGNREEGSKDINNFETPAKDPDRLATVPRDAPAAAPARTAPAKTELATQSHASPVKTPPRRRIVHENVSQPLADASGPGTARTGGTPGDVGSNHGNGTGVGNMGGPNTDNLDPRGLYEAGGGGGGGSGFDGLGSRGVIQADQPNPNFRSDGKVKYKVVIAPDGRVLAFEPVQGLTPGLRAPSLEAADYVRKNWRFEPIDRAAGNQVCYYTIRYKLS